ncbi:MAG: flavoprotein [Candidatus Methanofastidiosia archaeon]
MKRIAWGITGAGHFLEESIKIVEKLEFVDLFISLAGEEVLRMYKLSKRVENLKKKNVRIFRQRLESAPIAGWFYKPFYMVLVISPATSNTVAKFVCGISDSLITNLFAQAGKSKVPIVVLPTDVSEIIKSQSPKGKVTIYPRRIDLENVKKLRSFERVKVVKSTEELENYLESIA